MPLLESLDLRYCVKLKTHLAHLEPLVNLRSFRICCNDFYPMVVCGDLTSVSRLACVRELELGGCEELKGDVVALAALGQVRAIASPTAPCMCCAVLRSRFRPLKERPPAPNHPPTHPPTHPYHPSSSGSTSRAAMGWRATCIAWPRAWLGWSTWTSPPAST